MERQSGHGLREGDTCLLVAAAEAAESIRGELRKARPELGRDVHGDLMAFEARYDQFLADRFPVVRLCQYDARLFPGVEIVGALRCHRDTFQFPLRGS